MLITQKTLRDALEYGKYTKFFESHGLRNFDTGVRLNLSKNKTCAFILYKTFVEGRNYFKLDRFHASEGAFTIKDGNSIKLSPVHESYVNWLKSQNMAVTLTYHSYHDIVDDKLMYNVANHNYLFCELWIEVLMKAKDTTNLDLSALNELD